MNLASLSFIIFALFVTGINYLIPRKHRWIWLLICSYGFYATWGISYGIHLLLFTILSYTAGRWIEQIDQRNKKRLITTLTVVLIILLLLLFKYFSFWVETFFNHSTFFFNNGERKNLNWLIPIGISFFSLQAISYVVDVYRGTVKAERNFAKFALYLAFFPKLISGPFERIGHLLPQLLYPKPVTYQSLVNSFLRIGWGLFKKAIIADRLGIVVKTIFENPSVFHSPALIFGVLSFGMQIYLDFSAYSDIALGTANILGINLVENFNHPYFATSVTDFWRRWHISLSNWLRDYIFLPLNFRTRRIHSAWISTGNILLTFLVSGLWHEISLNFMLWGLLHGAFQAFELQSKSLQKYLATKLKIDRSSRSHHIFQIVLTFGLVNFAWIFFRAQTVEDAFYIIKEILLLNGFFQTNGWHFTLGLDNADFVMMLLGFFVFSIVEFFGRKRSLFEWVNKKVLPIRWTLYLLLLFSIILFGYHQSSEATRFLYSQF